MDIFWNCTLKIYVLVLVRFHWFCKLFYGKWPDMHAAIKRYFCCVCLILPLIGMHCRAMFPEEMQGNMQKPSESELKQQNVI